MSKAMEYLIQTALLTIVCLLLIAKAITDLCYGHVAAAGVACVFALIIGCLTIAAYEEYKQNKD